MNSSSEVKQYKIFSDGKPYKIEYLFSADDCIAADAHRTNFYSITFLKKGNLKVETNLFMHNVSAPALFVLSPEVIRKFYKTEAVEMITLFFDKEFFLESQSDIAILDKFSFVNQKDRHIIKLNLNNMTVFDNYFTLLMNRIETGGDNIANIVRSFIGLLLSECEAISYKFNLEREAALGREEQLLIEFKTLLSQHFIDHKQLNFYAERLGVTSKHLTSTIKKASGKTAGNWIKEMLILESRVLLKDNSLTVAQIADVLKFNDASHFGKFFKNNSGTTPLQYRLA